MLDAPPVQGGEYTVILDPILAGVFIHEAFGHLSEGDNVYENEELQDLMRLGKKVAARHPFRLRYRVGTGGARLFAL